MNPTCAYQREKDGPICGTTENVHLVTFRGPNGPDDILWHGWLCDDHYQKYVDDFLSAQE